MQNLQHWRVLTFCQLHIEKILLAILSLAWAPLSFYNFDSHHDGLILSTVTLTKSAISNGGEYPFNQYGPIWAIPFVILSSLVNPEHLFIFMRLLTVGFYFLSAFLLWKTSRFFVGAKQSIITVILFFGCQPFTTDFGSDLVPWPSAFVMPIAMTTAYLMFSIFDEATNKQKKCFNAVGIGLLIPLVIGSRLQVGVLLLGVALYAIHLSTFSQRKYFYFLIGLLFSSILVALALFHLGWMKDAFFDQIIYGATYLTADKSTFPKPIITITGILIFALLFKIVPLIIKLKTKFKKKSMLIFLTLVIIASVFIGMVLWHQRSIEPINVLVILTRRFWITFSLGALLYAVLKIYILQGRKIFAEIVQPKKIQFEILTLCAICLESQVYPLFDQMHFWWGSPLTLLVVVIILMDILNRIEIQPGFLGKWKKVSLLIILVTVLAPWSAQVGASKVAFPRSVGAMLYTSQSESDYQHSLQKFFDRNILKGERVLNLCEDTDVFFEQSKYISASRFFVYWGEPMSHSQIIYSSFLNSNPDVIVTCDLTHRPTIRETEEGLQAAILNKMRVNRDSVKIFSGKKQWAIYRF